MQKDELIEHIQKAHDSLLDFQRDTEKKVYNRLFEDNQKAMLVADEVGLGKTIVAKGVIASAFLKHLYDERKGKESFKVTYICSNQVIAQENLRKLNVFKNDRRKVSPINKMKSRISFLAYEDPKHGDIRDLFELNFLTPGTSFNSGSSTGVREERAILYSLLMEDPNLKTCSTAIGCILKAGVTNIEEWLGALKNHHKNHKIRDDLKFGFIEILKNRKIEITSEYRQFELKSTENAMSLYDLILEYAFEVNKENEDEYHRGCIALIRELRKALIGKCLDYIDADLYILDEFQRFKGLIDRDANTEEAQIAQKIFSHERARILLLSATPFKAFTTKGDEDRGEDHYTEFKVILKFLFNGDQNRLLEYEKNRRELFRQITSLKSDHRNLSDLNPEYRDNVERILKAVICRTERASVSDNKDIMVYDKWKDDNLEFCIGDIENFVSTDSVVQAMNSISKHTAGKPIEYCKSAAYPLSYLDRYKIKESLRNLLLKHPELKSDLKKAKHAWIDFDKIDKYEFSISDTKNKSQNSKLSHVCDETIEDRGHELLWVPPSMPYYDLCGSYKQSTGFSKTLIFSSWVMVPRMIASLLSYEVEKRTIGNSDTIDEKESATRTYFTPEYAKNYRRRPTPQLVFSTNEAENDTKCLNMSNFCILYPSITLSTIYDPLTNLVDKKALSTIKSDLEKKLRGLFYSYKLDKYETKNGESDKWYWATPLLFDRHHTKAGNIIKEWVKDRSKSSGDSAKEMHFSELKNNFESPDRIGLGRMPKDLFSTLADMTLGSPSVIALRSLIHFFVSSTDKSQYFEANYRKFIFTSAVEIADEMLKLFNKPESIAAIRLGTESVVFWKKVLEYCNNGCLQAVFDEYLHLIKYQYQDMEEIIRKLCESININVSSIKVDSLKTFIDSDRRVMRCHYAVDFGNQKIETEKGQERIKSIRENFNSPFRPFVLATTSIGQEGLDFHQYCRKIVHWNLPGNPIDLEQREGRINRYKGLVIRQLLSHKYMPKLANTIRSDGNKDIWTTLFEIADLHERRNKDKSELVPYWHVDCDDNSFKIERIIPLYPFSKDRGHLDSILETLALYRLTFGQPRQEELVEFLLQGDFTSEQIKTIKDRLIINLSP